MRENTQEVHAPMYEESPNPPLLGGRLPDPQPREPKESGYPPPSPARVMRARRRTVPRWAQPDEGEG